MAELKSALEIASKRIIPSTYGDKLALEKIKIEKKDKQRRNSLPDFIREWEDLINTVDGDKSKEFEEIDMGSVMIEDNSSRLFDLDEIKRKQLGKKQKAEKAFIPAIETERTESLEFNKDAPEVHWYGHFTSYTGFSRMNRAMTFGLSNKGVRVQPDIQASSVDINEATMDELSILSNQNISSTAPKVFGATVPISMFHGGYKILYTMMETSQTLHKDYVEKLNFFDEIWVPTYHGQEMFKDNGICPPIHVMPLGVDIDRYNTNQKPYNFPFETKEFVFVSVFKWGLRKGYDALIQSYLEEFTNEDDTTLLLVSRVHSPHEKGKIMGEVKSLLSSYGIAPEKLPHIALMDSEIHERDMPKIYRACDAFVLLSRGEGFGLPYYEAAACGLPVIGTNCSGQSDLMNATDGAFVVDPDLMVQAKINGPLSGLAKHCKFYEDQYFPSFGRSAIDQTREHMRYIYEDYEGALIKGEDLTQHVLSTCGWDVAVNNVYDRILELN